jgi:bifunctional DNA-binding transcriptional regulator/antitoxin component of YhaV-PrlF toxin-antitoxin module
VLSLYANGIDNIVSVPQDADSYSDSVMLVKNGSYAPITSAVAFLSGESVNDYDVLAGADWTAGDMHKTVDGAYAVLIPKTVADVYKVGVGDKLTHFLEKETDILDVNYVVKGVTNYGAVLMSVNAFCDMEDMLAAAEPIGLYSYTTVYTFSDYINAEGIISDHEVEYTSDYQTIAEHLSTNINLFNAIFYSLATLTVLLAYFIINNIAEILLAKQTKFFALTYALGMSRTAKYVVFAFQLMIVSVVSIGIAYAVAQGLNVLMNMGLYSILNIDGISITTPYWTVLLVTGLALLAITVTSLRLMRQTDEQRMLAQLRMKK